MKETMAEEATEQFSTLLETSPETLERVSTGCPDKTGNPIQGSSSLLELFQ